MSPPPDDGASARDLLDSSERLRTDLLAAVSKLDTYIEQLRAVMPNRTGLPDEPSQPS